MGVWIEIAIFRAFAAFSNVTPLVGVWIEIYQLNSGYQVLFSSLPSWECGLKSITFLALVKYVSVTPLVGVWIEILTKEQTLIDVLSLPSWECGLKSCYNDYNESTLYVTPLVGVWIEILIRAIKSLFFCRHSPRGSVD